MILPVHGRDRNVSDLFEIKPAHLSRYFGSGIHVTSRNRFLKVHADFNWYKKYSLSRRVNTFLYLNPDWNETFYGYFEMWNKDLNECPQKILPVLGRYVVFSTTDFLYHGYPESLAAPPDRSRR